MDDSQFAQFMQIQTRILEAVMSNAPRNVVQSNTALLPNFESFDNKKESFRNYKQRFDNYLKNEKSTNFNIITALVAPKNPDEVEYDKLVELLEKHLSPKRNVLVAQHQFLSKYQLENQTIADFVTVLRNEMGDCEFVSMCDCKASIADIFLRAQFIRGFTDNGIREQLLQDETANFDEIVSRAIALEASKIDSKELSKKTATPANMEINKISKKSGKHKNYSNKAESRCVQPRPISRNEKVDFNKLGLQGLCLHCGRNNHIAKDCRKKEDLHCSKCRRKDHVDKVCIRSLMNKAGKNQMSTNYIHKGNFQEFGINKIFDIWKNSQTMFNDQPFYAYFQIEGKTIKFEIDSGSPYSFLPRDQFSNLNLALLPTTISCHSYTRDVFVPEGKIKANVKYKDKIAKEDIYIVPTGFSALIGRTGIRNLSIDLSQVDQEFSTSTETIQNINNINNIDEFVSKFPDIFEEKIGCVPDYKVSLQLRENAKPVFFRERDVPYALREQVEKELDSLESDGIITKIENSDWGSPLMIIPKTDGNIRLCVDYKIGVNERLVGAHYSIRKIDSILNELRNSNYFCTLDLYKAYLHIPVDETSKDIQTISTHRGTYRMNRLPFGIKTAPSLFNRIIDQILRDVPKTESYFDDIIIHGKTREECESNVITCLTQLRKFDLHLNRKKCSFFQKRIDFLGYVIGANQILKSPRKIEAISKMPEPKSVDEVRRFLGMVTYYSRFILNMSTITVPLRQLLMKNAHFTWSKKCQQAFIKLKEEIISDRVLTPYNPDLPLQLACDASPTGIAGVLSHIINGRERPIAFASKSLTSAEKNYSQLDREALAIVFSFNHFYQYLFAWPFKLITDNRPLVRIFHQNSKIPQMTSARLQRYAAFLSGFNYVVEFRRGSENENVDCLSRAPIKQEKPLRNEIDEEVHQLCKASIHQISNSKLTFESIKRETLKDDKLSKILQQLQENSNENFEFTLDSNIIFRGARVVIPETLQPCVLQELHRTHIGITKMKQLARRYVYWKSIDRDIEHLVRSCEPCAHIKTNPVKATLHPWDEPETNWQRIHIDYAGPYQGYHFLVVIDAKSKWAEVEACKSAPTSASTIEILQDVFARNGFPDVLVSDNATIFTSEEFKKFCTQSGIFQKYIAPGHAATNGLAERNVQTLKSRLAAMVDEPLSMRQKIREILFRYRATPLSNSKTPAEQYLGRNLRIHLDALKPTRFKKTVLIPSGRIRQLSVGDRVLARYYSNNKSRWEPGIIIKRFGQLHYMVKLDNNFKFKRHINQLRATEIETKDSISATPVREADDNQQSFQQEINCGDLISFPFSAQESTVNNPDASLEAVLSLPEQPEPPLRRSNRQRQEPSYLNDYFRN